MALLEIEDLKISFGMEQGSFPAVNTLSLKVEGKQNFALIGESGCGKSVSALSILKLLPPNAKIDPSSKIFFQGRDLNSIGIEELRNIRGKEIGMVFQEPMSSLNPVFTIGKQLDEVFFIHLKSSKKEAKEKTLEILSRVKLPHPEKIYGLYPHELSGGMRQRVMIGMAIACSPSLLIADEPTTALDVTIQMEIMKLFERIQEKSRSILFISHNLLLVKEFSHQIAIMYLGEILEQADSEEIFRNPLHPYTKGLLKAIPRIGTTEKLNEIPGFVPSIQNIPVGSCRFYDRCDYKMPVCLQSHPELKGNSKHSVRCFLYEKN